MPPLIKLRFEVLGEVQLSRAFEDIAGIGDDLTEPFNDMAEEYYVSQSQVFDREGAFENRSKWPALSIAYARWKKKKFPGKKILELTGRMKKAATIRGAADNITRITHNEMTVGLSTPYAMKHQKGLEGLPQRKIIELTDRQKKDWTRIMHNYLYNAQRKILRNRGVLSE